MLLRRHTQGSLNYSVHNAYAKLQAHQLNIFSAALKSPTITTCHEIRARTSISDLFISNSSSTTFVRYPCFILIRSSHSRLKFGLYPLFIASKSPFNMQLHSSYIHIRNYCTYTCLILLPISSNVEAERTHVATSNC